MSTDKARLCDAIEIACDHLGIPTSTEDQEAILFAVLTALKEPTGMTQGYIRGEWSRRNVESMVDDILIG